MADCEILTGIENMDIATIHRYLSEDSYWAKAIPFDVVKTSLQHSFCVGAFVAGKQVGFGRIITDYSTFGYIADIFVLPEYRGQGISKKIVGYMMEQSWAKQLRRNLLYTRDGHGLYSRFGFKAPAFPEYVMEIHQPNIYLK